MTELAFDESSHTYSIGGSMLPSVTQILQQLTDFSRVPPDVLAAKAALGTRVHAACEYDDEGDLDESSVDADVEPYLQGYRRFLADTRARVVCNEQRVWHATYRYAGTLDRVMIIDGERWLIDIKTSIATPATAGPQTAAYLAALGDRSVTRRGALRLRPDATYRLDALTGADDWSVFLACLTIHNWRMING